MRLPLLLSLSTRTDPTLVSISMNPNYIPQNRNTSTSSFHQNSATAQSSEISEPRENNFRPFLEHQLNLLRSIKLCTTQAHRKILFLKKKQPKTDDDASVQELIDNSYAF